MSSPTVNRFLDRVYHPDRLTTALRRTDPKGTATFEPATWDDALGEIATKLTTLAETIGSESIRPNRSSSSRSAARRA